jgi:hypothetical protein
MRVMSREIKFRGLRADGKGWVCGDLMTNGSIAHISNFDNGVNREHYEVKPETVGLFITELYGDTPVYNGDIMQMQCDVGGVKPCYVIANDGIDWVLKFHGRSDGMDGQIWGRLSRLLDAGIMRLFGKLVVIGNIHEQ